jgi:polyketide synthase PksN
MENKRSHADISYHPVSIKELDIYHSCTSNMWAKLQYAPNRGNEDCIPSLDVEMCDEQGKVCIRIRGLVTVSNEYPAIQIGF